VLNLAYYQISKKLLFLDTYIQSNSNSNEYIACVCVTNYCLVTSTENFIRKCSVNWGDGKCECKCFRLKRKVAENHAPLRVEREFSDANDASISTYGRRLSKESIDSLKFYCDISPFSSRFTWEPDVTQTCLCTDTAGRTRRYKYKVYKDITYDIDNKLRHYDKVRRYSRLFC